MPTKVSARSCSLNPTRNARFPTRTRRGNTRPSRASSCRGFNTHPGNANLRIGGWKTAIRENGVPALFSQDLIKVRTRTLYGSEKQANGSSTDIKAKELGQDLQRIRQLTISLFKP